MFWTSLAPSWETIQIFRCHSSAFWSSSWSCSWPCWQKPSCTDTKGRVWTRCNSQGPRATQWSGEYHQYQDTNPMSYNSKRWRKRKTKCKRCKNLTCVELGLCCNNRCAPCCITLAPKVLLFCPWRFFEGYMKFSFFTLNKLSSFLKLIII